MRASELPRVLALAVLLSCGCARILGLDELSERPEITGAAGGGGWGGAASCSPGRREAGEVIVPLTDAAASIDGSRDAVYDCGARIDLEPTPTGAATEVSAVSWVLATNAGLCLFVEVTDPVTHEAFFWYDAEHLWLGLDPRTPPADSFELPALAFALAPNDRDVHTGEGWPAAALSAVLVAQREDAVHGYEVLIPWEVGGLAQPPEPGRRLRLEVGYSDFAEAGQAAEVLSWSPSSDPQEPTTWGTLVLE